jgi:hypothetical protein
MCVCPPLLLCLLALGGNKQEVFIGRARSSRSELEVAGTQRLFIRPTCRIHRGAVLVIRVSPEGPSTLTPTSDLGNGGQKNQLQQVPYWMREMTKEFHASLTTKTNLSSMV